MLELDRNQYLHLYIFNYLHLLLITCCLVMSFPKVFFSYACQL